MSDTTPSQAAVLVRKASEDCKAVALMASGQGISRWIVGFHAQQAVEKALKAVLASHRVAYPFTHDLEALVKLLRKSGVTPPPHAETLSMLTPFGTLFRYEDEDLEPPESPDFGRILQEIKDVLAWAEKIIGGTVKD